jgi:hypothetical protein
MPQSAQQVLEERIDERRVADGAPTAAQERKRVDEEMRSAGARFAPKVVATAGPAPAARLVLSVERFESAQAKRNVWDVVATHGTKIEDVLDPRYWTNIGPQLRQWDHIEIRCEDGSWYAEVIVEDRGPRHAKVAVLNYVQLAVADPEGPSLPPGYQIAYKGPHIQWAVIRDGHMLREKFSSYGMANSWLNDHLRAVIR